MRLDLRTLLFGRENRIGRRLIVLVVAFSALITLCISAIQLALEYRALRSALERQLDGIAIHVPAIAASVWDFDDRQILRAIDALVLLPGIVEARVIAKDSKGWVAGRAATENVVTRTYPLRFASRGKEQEIGTLEVIASLEGIKGQMLGSAVGIVLGTGLQTLLVAIFMVILIRRLLTNRLESMAGKVRALAPDIQPMRQAVEIHPQPMPEGLDELDAVAWMLDKTAEDLQVAVAALKRLNEDLEGRVAARTQDLEAFSYSVSHDLRAPLRAINGYARILLEDYGGKLDGEGVRLLDSVCKSAERMGELIDDMLQFSRLGRDEMKMAEVDMGGLLHSVLDELQPLCNGRRIEWAMGAMPAARGDAAMIRQVLTNLLTNAIKFTQQRETARIEVGGSASGGECVYAVRDNGVGFDMQYAGKLFGVFERLHGKNEFEGTGIGLAIVKRVVTRHGGRVWAESRLNEGTTIHFSLPLAEGVD